jgi:transposase
MFCVVDLAIYYFLLFLFSMTFPLSDKQRWKIIFLLKQNSLSHRAIARTIKCHYNTVANIAKLYNNNKNIIQRPRSGRPRKIKKGHQLSFRLTLRRNPTATTTELQHFLQRKKHLRVSSSTIKRTRRLLHFHPATEIIQPKLTKTNKKKRLEYARAHLNENWKLVVFSDEKLFTLGETRNRVWIEKGRSIPVREVTKQNYSVMVWGAIWYQGRSTLSLTTHKLQSKQYCDILDEHLLPSYPNQQFLFQQDNAPTHVSKYTTSWLQQHAVNLLPNYPPYSPDCNPIELIWSQMSHTVNSMSPTTPQQLHTAIEHAWDEITQSSIQSTINRLPGVLQTIIERDGDRH